MAITVDSGGVANSDNAAVTSLAAGGFTAVASAKTVVAIGWLDSAISISSVTTNGTGTYGGDTIYFPAYGLNLAYYRSITNESSGAGRIITANFSGATACAIAVQQYSGVGVGVTYPTVNMQQNVTAFMQGRQDGEDAGDFILSFMAFAASASDTIAASVGNLRRSTVGAAGGAGVALVDTGAIVGGGSFLNEAKLTGNRQWGVITRGLVSGDSGIASYEDYQGVTPIMGSPTTKDVIVVSAFMPEGNSGGILPPGGAHGQIFPPAII